MTPPECTTAETRALKAWYLSELEEMQDELRELRRLQHEDRVLLLELSDLVRHTTGVSVNPRTMLQ
jgi:hypothetical protein